MDRSDVAELHFITHRENLPSILAHGIHCHTSMKGRPHVSIASTEVQDIRAGVMVPGGLKLHDYANLYFDARNPMMYKVRRIWRVQEAVVVRLDARVLDIANVVVTDGNAASQTTEFYNPSSELHLLDKTRIFAESWNHSDPWEKIERRRQRCAEVLVPTAIPPAAVKGLYVETPEQARACQQLVPNVPVEVKPYVFFC